MELKIALAGNPNCGKTTLFNDLTGSAQYVGNWPGVTVEKKEGRLRDHKDVIIQDLPGIYSLSPYTLEEVVSRNYLVNEKPDAIIDIVDGTNIERNLYLTTQLLELNIPMVIAVNMMDLVKKSGNEIDTEKLSRELGCAVIEMSALKGMGSMKAAEKAIELGKAGTTKERPHVFTGSVEHAIAHIEESIQDKVDERNIRWFAVKVFERDEKVLEQLQLDEAALHHIESHIKDCEAEAEDDAESIITNQRYEYIQGVVSRCYKKKSKENLTLSDKIDKVVTNRFLALPIFALVMFLVYFVSVSTIGDKVTTFTNDVLFAEWIEPAVRNWMENAGASSWAVSLVVDGIINGISVPVGFVPQMAIVFLFLSILEDVGYMARVAFIMDRAFRKFGLSGKSFIPFLISSGCGVPGIMSTRTIEDVQDRRMTMMVTTSIPCGAKLPVIAAIAGYIMGGAWWVAPLMYFAGIAVVICSCIILKKTKMFAGDPAPFVMELPQYHIPSIKGVLLHVWERVWAFIKKAGTIIMACVIVMWFLGSYGFTNGSFGAADAEHSLLAVIGGSIAFIFKPLGFGTWKAVASTFSGFAAKESIVGTMGVIAGIGEVETYAASMHSAFAAFFPTAISAISFLFFNLFDSPCFAAIGSMAREMGSRKYFWFALLYQNVNSYCIALMVYQLAGLAVGQVAFGAGTVVALAVLAVYAYLLFRPDPNKRRRFQARGNMAGEAV
ncbi:MAG: ferrous iron transport protein B [Anaerovoracaceae bacterium]